jgi:DNA polymerase III subunit beta
MRLVISREKLQEGLTAVGPSIAAKSTLPVLGNFLLEAREKSLYLCGTDLDIAVMTEVAAEVEVPGAITIPARKLIEIARELSPAPVRIGSLGEQRLELECGRSHFKILGLPKDEFPALPVLKFNQKWRINSGDFQKLIGHTAFAVSTEESRPILNGVLWELSGESMKMVATNGHRLACMGVGMKSVKGMSGAFIVPPKALEQVRRLFPADEELEIGQGENYLGFRSPFTAIYTRLIEGPNPPYDKVNPRDNDKVGILDKTALIGALRRMSVIASDQTHRIRMALNAGILRFSVQTPDLGEADDEMPVQYSGDPLEIGFNANYLLEILRYMPTDDVKMTFKGPDRAATIEPHEWKDPSEYLCLIMPLRLVD